MGNSVMSSGSSAGESAFELQVLLEASKSPSVAVMRVAIEMDKQLRILLAVAGVLKRYDGSTPRKAIEILDSVAGVEVPPSLRSAISDFWSVRNDVLHGQQESLALRAIDYGLRIIKILRSIKRPAYIVRYIDIPLYSDENCMILRQDVHGVILEAFSGENKSFGLNIFPTTRKYAVGDSLTWEWNTETDGWDTTWFRDPSTNNQIKQAWSGALEFVGRLLDEV